MSERIKVERFAKQMMIELDHNRHKGSILDVKDFNFMITELEYHKAKMFLAIRTKNKLALREYIADVANALLMIGNYNGLYDKDLNDTGLAYELNKDFDLIKQVSILDQSKDQKLID